MRVLCLRPHFLFKKRVEQVKGMASWRYLLIAILIFSWCNITTLHNFSLEECFKLTSVLSFLGLFCSPKKNQTSEWVLWERVSLNGAYHGTMKLMQCSKVLASWSRWFQALMEDGMLIIYGLLLKSLTYSLKFRSLKFRNLLCVYWAWNLLCSFGLLSLVYWQGELILAHGIHLSKSN